MNTTKFLSTFNQKVLDKDSFSIIKNMVKEWEKDEERVAIEKSKKKMGRVLDQMKGFQNSLWWIVNANYLDDIPTHESEIYHGENMLYFINEDNKVLKELDYGF